MIRISAITLASDSAITVARFRPSKSQTFFYQTSASSLVIRLAGSQKGGFQKGGFFWRMFLDLQNRNEGTKISVIGPQRPERGPIRQDHPFTKPSFCFPESKGREPRNTFPDRFMRITTGFFFFPGLCASHFCT